MSTEATPRSIHPGFRRKYRKNRCAPALKGRVSSTNYDADIYEAVCSLTIEAIRRDDKASKSRIVNEALRESPMIQRALAQQKQAK